MIRRILHKIGSVLYNIALARLDYLNNSNARANTVEAD